MNYYPISVYHTVSDKSRGDNMAAVKFSDKVSQLLNDDNDKIDRLITENPDSISVTAIAKFLNMDATSVRSAIENNTFGISWKKNGSARHGYFIPTAQFVRWYLLMGA